MQASPFRRRFGFWCGVPFYVHEWGNERDLKIDLLAPERGRAGQRGDLIQRVRKLRCGFNQR